ncbi:MAG: NfeD family protein [Opitutales bacterium]|nr:NfeD family protein [Opitutales bacterium]
MLILLGTYASMTTMLFIFPMAAAWIAYEWIFWFPTDGEEDPDPTEVLFQPRKVPEIVGKEGEAVEELKPTGRVRIDGKVYTAVSNNGWVDRGERVVVERSDGYGLTVTKRIGRNGG